MSARPRWSPSRWARSPAPSEESFAIRWATYRRSSFGHEIYVTASVLGACTYVGLNGLGLDRLAAMIAGFLVTFIVRSLAITFGWSLPVFRESTNREPWNRDRNA